MNDDTAFEQVVAEGYRRRRTVQRRVGAGAALAAVVVAITAVAAVRPRPEPVRLATAPETSTTVAGQWMPYETTIPTMPGASTAAESSENGGPTATSTTVPGPSSTSSGPATTIPAQVSPRVIAMHATYGGGRYENGGIMRVTFDQPVKMGTKPLHEMYLVSHMTDASCASPGGNGHEVLSGEGTTEIVIEVSALARPITYISIAPGFVTDMSGQAENEGVRCEAVDTA